MTFEVEKNIPIPSGAKVVVGSNDVYKWDRLEVGDSMFIPDSEVPPGKKLSDLRNKIYNAARKFGAPKGRKFLSLVVEEERPNPDYREQQVEGAEPIPEKIKVWGVRTWRLKDLEVMKAGDPTEEPAEAGE